MLPTLISKNEKILEEKFKIKPELTNYKTYDKIKWKDFLETRISDDNPEGIFLPRNLSANLLKNTEFFETNFNHEYFGHGLFCEYSLIGKELVKKDKELEDLEKRILGKEELPEDKKITIKVDKIIADEYLKKKNEINEFVNQNLYLYEGFAIWMEYFLAKENGGLELFNKKFEKLNENLKKSFDNLKRFEESYGEYALIYSLYFPKHYDKNIIKELIRNLYEENYQKIEFALLYGSKKPYSDIDLFIVSNNASQTYQNDWIDVYEFNKNDFEKGLNLMDISITDPLFTGEVIIGNEAQINYYRDYVKNLQVSNEMISYNLTRSRHQKEVALAYPNDSKEYKIGNKYSKTCYINAKELSKGNKILTLKNIEEKYSRINSFIYNF